MPADLTPTSTGAHPADAPDAGAGRVPGSGRGDVGARAADADVGAGAAAGRGGVTGGPGRVGAALLLLGDGRLPSGGHAHSGGVEPVAELLGGLDDVASFLAGKLHATGLVAAALAAAACLAEPAPETGSIDPVSGAGSWSGAGGSPWTLARLDAEADARTASPAAREASRRQGRQLLRAVREVWPSARYAELGDRPHHPLVLGVAAGVAGLWPGDVAVAAAHGVVTGAASAAVRLLSLDPIAVHRLLAELGPEVDAVAAAATAAVVRGELPAPAAPLAEIAAEDHATWEVRLFAS